MLPSTLVSSWEILSNASFLSFPFIKLTLFSTKRSSAANFLIVSSALTATVSKIESKYKRRKAFSIKGFSETAFFIKDSFSILEICFLTASFSSSVINVIEVNFWSNSTLKCFFLHHLQNFSFLK